MTKLQTAIEQVQSARAELAELEAARQAARASLESIEEQIAAGAGIETPALFGHRRDRQDLLAWLAGQVDNARGALASAERHAAEIQSAIAGARRQRDELLAIAKERQQQGADLIEAVRATGDLTGLAVLDARYALLQEQLAVVNHRLADLGEPAS